MANPKSGRILDRIVVLDSHTEGEPTRVVVNGAPDLGAGTARDRARRFASAHRAFMRSVVTEPRGHDAVVGALLLEPTSADAVAQVIFFNNVGCLHMCVHGTIGVAETLVHLGRIDGGRHRLETPVGDVWFELLSDGRVAVDNVPSRRAQSRVEVTTERHGTLRGDVAWGGNWFFLIDDPRARIGPQEIEALTDLTWDIRQSLRRSGVTGSDGLEIDHVEVFGRPDNDGAMSKNFVLCPGKAWDRSPCGTGTSAKTACLAAAGKLEPGESFVQESTIGSCFEASYRNATVDDELPESITGDGPWIVPTIRGRAYMTGETTLLLDSADPFRCGFVSDRDPERP
ncbi:MAG: proline racemase family protein [Planctomycetes bacterium]|nr:proline racemase family protein [Planctomycetota bacterium]MCB9891082.1 proline racemase family protein [Planctomycetota bacterium]MCB9916957.1 proline racemase family protein [Planctomycetota bacterium]